MDSSEELALRARILQSHNPCGLTINAYKNAVTLSGLDGMPNADLSAFVHATLKHLDYLAGGTVAQLEAAKELEELQCRFKAVSGGMTAAVTLHKNASDEAARWKRNALQLCQACRTDRVCPDHQAMIQELELASKHASAHPEALPTADESALEPGV